MKQAALVVSEGQFEIYNSFAEARAYLSANIGWVLDNLGSRTTLSRRT